MASTIFGHRVSTLFAEIKRTSAIALPLMGAQLLQLGNGVVDALVAGRLGSTELAAGGIGAGLWFFTSLLCIGLLAGLSPTISRMIGERRRAEAGAVFRQGIWLALAVGIAALLLLLALAYSLEHWGIQAELVQPMRDYLYTACWSLPAFGLVMVARNVCEATSVTRPVLLIQAVGLLVNTAADLTLGLGLFGFPQLGLQGIGIATSLVMVSMAVCLLFYLTSSRFDRYQLFARFDWPSRYRLTQMFKLSLPIYLGILFEAGLFTATGVQAGMLTTLDSAAHNIALSVSGACFMLPLGLSFALTARVGRVYGRQQLQSIRLRVTTGLLFTVILAVITATVVFIFRSSLAEVYSTDLAVQALAKQLLLITLLFQLSDGFQVVLTGMLRGLDDLRIPMLINFVSYWVVAFPLGVICSRYFNLGVTGLWVGLVGGLSLAAVLLALRLKYRLTMLRHWN